MRFPRGVPTVGSRRGDWILKARRRNPDGTFTDTWILDPTVIVTPFEEPYYCSSEATGYGDGTNGYIWKTKRTVVGAENSATSLKTGKAAAGTYFGFYCGLTDKAVTGLPANFPTGGGWRNESLQATSPRPFFLVKARVLNRAAYAHAGKICVRVWKGTSADGTALGALTSWIESPNILSFTATAGEAKADVFPVDVTFSLGIDEYFYVQFAWKVTTAATNASAGVKLAVNTTTPTAILIPSTTNKAYKGTLYDELSYITTPDATTEFTSTEYTNVSSDNAVYASTSISGSLVEWYISVAHRFTFDLTTYNTSPNQVTQVIYKWDGYRSGATPDMFQVFQHKETTGWVTDSTTVPTTDGAGFEYTKTLTNISAILISNKFEFGLALCRLLTGAATLTINSDYVELEVTYTVVVVKKPIMKIDKGSHPRSRLIFNRSLKKFFG